MVRTNDSINNLLEYNGIVVFIILNYYYPINYRSLLWSKNDVGTSFLQTVHSCGIWLFKVP